MTSFENAMFIYGVTAGKTLRMLMVVACMETA
jgi:hypothetical protein